MRLRRSALSFLLLTGLSLGALSPALAAEDPTPADSSAVADPTADGASAATDQLSVPATPEDAQASLAEVKDLFGPMTRSESRSMITSGEGKDATLALRDLSLRLGSLSSTQRNSAYAEFQRPAWADDATVSNRYCPPTGNICLHWIKTTASASRGTDDLWAINTVYPTLMHVSQTYVSAGYRKPRGDGSIGGSAQTDIYLDDVGSEGKYGYCTVDVDDTGHYVFHPSNSRASDLPAFCVLDNDFKHSQFPTDRTAKEDLEVTAAHEYFHATQFAYDYLEDRWFMEATATWAEDQLYDSINDNVQYLQRSQLRYPGLSLDTFNGAGGFLHYGDWLYFEYLTERAPARKGALPALMLRMWQYADSVSGPDYYSIQAVAHALRERHLDFNKTFAQYAAANRHPATAYSEGRANHYPTTRPKRTVFLKPSHRSASAAYKVDHLASATTRFVPTRLKSKRTKLTLSVDMANKKLGSVAAAIVYFKNGRITTKLVRLGRNGNGAVRVPFSSRTVGHVELVLVNANHSYRNCWSDTPYSCSGVPAHNKVNEKVSARVS
ncbi:hypothetical protein GCM10009798_17380 [Nocardioides panacihumi]|uniref:Uncharacterized protein n=1 Tax=Nocardioides panacihumi TaxID=400774 RepID=A0ABN2QUJ8_9ACTN